LFLLWIITFEPETPAGHAKYQNTWDCSLVSNENLDEILTFNGLGPGPGDVGQGSLEVLHLRHHTKIPQHQPKNFFRVQSRRLAVSFEPLNSSLPLSAPELCSRKATCNLFSFWYEILSHYWMAKCWTILWTWFNSRNELEVYIQAAKIFHQHQLKQYHLREAVYIK